MDGFEVCRILRKESNVPILMLTAKGEEVDKVVGLEIGADDYVTKPFSMRELMARVKAMLRRSQVSPQIEESKEDVLRSGDLEVDKSSHAVTLGGTTLPMKPREFDLLSLLVENKGRALTRDRILELLWGHGYVGDERTVDVHVRWLRNKIEDDPSNPGRIVTIRGVGYRFEG
jgi:DNA-binding response OmpR family regulator